jgi:[ribosomal protein S5]-alanine N-acetyltransferase
MGYYSSMTSSSTTERPSFKTRRLQCEPVESRHAEAMVQVLSDPESHRYLSGDPPSFEYLHRQYTLLESGKSPDGTEHWLTWIVVRSARPVKPIGYVQATVREPETVHIAYFLEPAAWGQGFASEAVEGMLNTVVQRYRVERIIAEMDTRNGASIRLAERLGLKRIKLVKGADEYKGAWVDEYVYELCTANWKPSTAL